MSEDLRSLLPSAVALTTMAVIALRVTMVRHPRVDAVERRRLVRSAAVAVLVQAGHFVEELTTGFHDAFPAVFGSGPMSTRLFVIFNVTWLVIWVACLPGLARGYRAAFFPVWFLAIALIANGVGHPLLALLTGGYFPGVGTAPITGVVGAWLLFRLAGATSPSAL